MVRVFALHVAHLGLTLGTLKLPKVRDLSAEPGVAPEYYWVCSAPKKSV